MLREEPKDRYTVKQIKNHKWCLRSFSKNKSSPSNSPSESPLKRIRTANGSDSSIDQKYVITSKYIKIYYAFSISTPRQPSFCEGFYFRLPSWKYLSRTWASILKQSRKPLSTWDNCLFSHMIIFTFFRKSHIYDKEKLKMIYKFDKNT